MLGEYFFKFDEEKTVIEDDFRKAFVFRLQFPHPGDRIRIYVVGRDVMPMTEEEKVVIRSPLFVRLFRVVSFSAWLCGFDVTKLCDVLTSLGQYWVITSWERALVLGSYAQVA